jgi:hypothetical protein
VSTVDGRLEHWDPKSFAPLRSVRVVVQPQSRPQSLAISGSRIFSASADRVIAYDLESLEVLTELRDIQWGQVGSSLPKALLLLLLLLLLLPVSFCGPLRFPAARNGRLLDLRRLQ